MRNAYATDEMGEEEKAGLRITNPDPAASPASLVGPAPPVIAMPTPSARASAAPRHDAGADGGSDKQSALRSPGTYYNTLRAMTHSPARAYPVPPPPPAHGGGNGTGAGAGAQQRWDSTATSADADMYAEDSRPASRSVYSQVTAIGLEEGEEGGRGSAMHGAGRHRASGRASGYTYTEANSSAARGAGGGGGRAGYDAPLAYVPVFKK